MTRGCHYLVLLLTHAVLGWNTDPLCRPTVDVIFLLDGSDSISPDEFQQQKDLIQRFVQISDISSETVRVGFAVVSSNVGDTLMLPQGTSKTALTSALRNVTQPQDGSRTDIGIFRMEEMFGSTGRPGVLRIGVILTDGRAKFEQATVAEATLVKDSGVFLVAIGIGRLINFDELVKLASTKSNAYHLVPVELSSKLLSETVKFLGRESCTGHQMVDPSWIPAPPEQPQSTQAQETSASSVTKSPIQIPPTAEPEISLLEALQILSGFNVPIAPGVTLVPLASDVTVNVPTSPKPPVTSTQKPTVNPMYMPSPQETIQSETMRTGSDANSGNFSNSSNQELFEFKVANLIRSFMDTPSMPMPMNEKQVTFDMPVKRLFEFDTLGNIKLDVPKSHVKERTKISNSLSSSSSSSSSSAAAAAAAAAILEAIAPSPKPATHDPILQDPDLTYEEQLALCTKGKIYNGVVYTLKPGSCSEFLQCYDVNGVTYVQTGRCPFETVFDDQNGVCRYYMDMYCPRDPCYDLTIKSYSHPGNCRAFWSCTLYGSSTPACCASGTSYVSGQGCVRNISCTDTCMDFGNLNTVTSATECKLLPFEANGHFYFEEVAGLGWMIRKCPDGADFDRSVCKCQTASQQMAKTCKPQLMMDFNDGFRDKSGQGIAMGLTQVDVEEGAARFNGRAFIKLWRFSGMSLGQKVTVSFRFRVSVSAVPGKLMHIVSNCCYGCKGGPQPSIDIAIVYGGETGIAVLSARTAEAGEVFVYVPYNETVTGWNDLLYIYDGYALTGVVNDASFSRNVIGDIIGRSEELTIGTCDTDGGYDGYIDDFKFYMCVP